LNGKIMAPECDDEPKRFRDQLIEITNRKLPGQAGKIYANTTRLCLEIREEGASDEDGQKVLRQIIEDLNSCVI